MDSFSVDMSVAEVVRNRVCSVLLSESIRYDHAYVTMINVQINGRGSLYITFHIDKVVLKGYICDYFFMAETTIFYNDPDLFDNILKCVKAQMIEIT